MPRSERGELVRLHREVVRSRLKANAMREDMIQALGDWLCGSGLPPPLDELKALAALCQAQEAAEARYGRYVAALSEEVVARAQRAGS